MIRYMVLNLLDKILQCCYVLGQNQCFTKHRTSIQIRLLYNRIHFCLCHNKTTIQSVDIIFERGIHFPMNTILNLLAETCN